MATYLPAYERVREPFLRFHCSEDTYQSQHPIRGLLSWGPFDASIPGFMRPNPLRVAVICPRQSEDLFLRFLGTLGSTVQRQSGKEYLENWPGFKQAFTTNLELPPNASPLLQLISEEAATEARSQPNPEAAFLDMLKQHLRLLLPVRHEFHVVLIYLPERWSDFWRVTDGEYEFDLHDALKAFGAPNGVPIQIVTDNALSYFNQARVLWWLSLALYVKGGGIPWKLVEASPGTAFIGLSYGICRTPDKRRIVTGCSQVFDEHGEGLKFLLYPGENYVFRGKNLFMSREDARRLFGKLRDVYQELNEGNRPSRVVVHKTTHFAADEMAGIADALSGVQEIELLQVQQDARWRAIAFDSRRERVSGFPVMRGTAVPLDRFGFLLWTQGNVTGIAEGGLNYYQEKRGIPSPLVIRRFRGTCPLGQIASEILRLTKMNWNNHQLYSRLPVTLEYATCVAKIAKQVLGEVRITQGDEPISGCQVYLCVAWFRRSSTVNLLVVEATSATRAATARTAMALLNDPDSLAGALYFRAPWSRILRSGGAARRVADANCRLLGECSGRFGAPSERLSGRLKGRRRW